MDYIQLTCHIESNNIELTREVLMQELADLGFESFEETKDGLLAYIQAEHFTKKLLISLPQDILGLGTASFTHILIKDRNWNEEWEKSFQPVLVADKCYIRAPFHSAKPTVQYEIIIEPKMAFGTGHHETTSQMVELMLSLDFSEKRVLDMGCGTGVLAIMASMLKAKQVLAIDIDEWSYRSTLENSTINKVENITAKQGDIDLIDGLQFDVILANINRNILLNQIPHYFAALQANGLLLMSGIYKSDFETIHSAAIGQGFKHSKTIEKNNWIALVFEKN